MLPSRALTIAYNNVCGTLYIANDSPNKNTKPKRNGTKTTGKAISNGSANFQFEIFQRFEVSRNLHFPFQHFSCFMVQLSFSTDTYSIIDWNQCRSCFSPVFPLATICSLAVSLVQFFYTLLVRFGCSFTINGALCGAFSKWIGFTVIKLMCFYLNKKVMKVKHTHTHRALFFRRGEILPLLWMEYNR